ncbi:MAG: GTP-binding protein [Deltaproteobacteria bacterium]|nr:GTP-binding protein [Deltaproteobacteria bacterium]
MLRGLKSHVGRWDPRLGEREQQLVWIGQRLDEPGIRALLDACLVEEGLLQGSPDGWPVSPHPFPEYVWEEEADGAQGGAAPSAPSAP